MKALILNNVVVELSETEFEVHPSLTWMDAPEGCNTGWELVGDTLQKPADPSEAVVASIVRNNRDHLLSDTDWIIIKAYERKENVPGEWEVYRQALRDITTQAGFPYSVVWPTKPE